MRWKLPSIGCCRGPDQCCAGSRGLRCMDPPVTGLRRPFRCCGGFQQRDFERVYNIASWVTILNGGRRRDATLLHW